jgi:hypothetical protein
MSSPENKPLTIPPEREAEMTPAVRAFVESLLEQIEKLKVRVGLNPQNSSLPPRTQHPHTRPQPPKRKSKRKRGGQPGHEKHERPLIPPNQGDDMQPLKPTECRRCGAKLSGSDPEPLRHQVWELPEIKPLVTEYQRHRLTCPCGGETTCAELPIGVPPGQSGPRLMALTALLMAFYRQSKRRTADFLGTLWATALDIFLGDTFRGIVTCDRAKMHWQGKRLPWCGAHWKRDFQAMIDRGNPRSTWLGQRLRRTTCELFEHGADYRAGRITRAALLRRMGPVRRKVERLLLRGMPNGNRDVRGTCRELYEHRAWLWTFLRHEGVEPTNNAGERSLRHAVIWRKLSFGTPSASGSRFVETMLTVIESCRQQRRNAFAFITAAVEAHLAHQSTPSLLPRV